MIIWTYLSGPVAFDSAVKGIWNVFYQVIQWCPLPDFLFLYVCHSYRFQIVRQVWILDKDNTRRDFCPVAFFLLNYEHVMDMINVVLGSSVTSWMSAGRSHICSWSHTGRPVTPDNHCSMFSLFVYDGFHRSYKGFKIALWPLTDW